jgi:O-antigen/teichoic acid export membrane protein
MPASTHFNRATWTLADQGLVSLGAFLVNIELARHLPPDRYGTFALLLGGFLGLQVVTSSLLLYPMSIRLPILQGPDRTRLLAATIVLVAALCVPLCLALGTTVAMLDNRALVLPAVAMFVGWQMQEGMRRGLLAQFRHSEAIIGDAFCYFSQVAGLAALIYTDNLTLDHALYTIAAAYSAGAVIQAIQLHLSFRQLAALRATALEFWTIGSWSLVNNVLAVLRIQILPWALAAMGGAAAAASFQAVVNVVNLTNPILLGLCNVIPQTAARAQHTGGNGEAWRAVRTYMLIGAPPSFGYYALIGLLPWLPLTIIYGSASPYATLTLPVQILAGAWTIGYFAEMICSYLHGVKRARLALIVNLVGMLTVLVTATDLIRLYGLVGACLALVAANLARLATAAYIQKRVATDEYVAA